MSVSVTILGSNSAIPTPKRNNSAHVLNVNERFFLIDCAEGTQVQLQKYSIKFQRINHIFISHLHADHYLGIFGLISTFNLLGRKKELNIYAHSDLEEKMNIIFDKEVFCFNIIFHKLNFKSPELILDYKNLLVTSFPLKHRVEVCGFLFKEKIKELNIRKDAISRYNLSVLDIVSIKKGSDFILPDGNIIENSKLTFPPEKPGSYAYCSDTRYLENIISIIKDVDILYHESTFDATDKNLAKKTGHSTSEDAATIAQKSNAGKLIIGHFSARYPNTDKILQQAKNIFPRTFAVKDGDVYTKE